MSFLTILILLAVSLLLRLLVRFGRRREWMLMASVLAVFWLQPEPGIRNLDLWFPLTTVFLIVLSWLIVTPNEVRKDPANLRVGIALAGLSLLLAACKFLKWQTLFTASIPTGLFWITVGVFLWIGIFFLLIKTTRNLQASIPFYGFLLILLFLFLKEPHLATQLSSWLRSLNHQNPQLAGAHELAWLGYSYIAFRLLHTLRDHQNGLLPPLVLRDYLLFVIFYPTLQAGPIDRIQRFEKDLSDRLTLIPEDFIIAGKRLATGLMKKFVLANGLAVIALSNTTVFQIEGAGWMWASLYAYSFMIYFDFSGYTDIAIGLARLLGVKTPENFNHPYLQPNLTMFWNNWHITLTQWFRAYFFNPLTRSLRRHARRMPVWMMILIPQLLTMTLIGLWHGITWNFALWGIWHGLGLFIQNRWSAWIQSRQIRPYRLLPVINVFFTFHYVSLGWVFFLTQDVSGVVHGFSILMGR